MARAENKTKATRSSVEGFLGGLDEERRKDCEALVPILRRVTKAEPKMWGSSIVGFGDLHYKYASGREGDWFVLGFSPRKKDLTLYGMGRARSESELAERLGKHKTGKGCIYIQRLADVDVAVLEEMAKRAVRETKREVGA